MTLTCCVQTQTKPTSIKWLQNNITIEFLHSLTESHVHNGTHLIATLNVIDFSERDYGLYLCNVTTMFG